MNEQERLEMSAQRQILIDAFGVGFIERAINGIRVHTDETSMPSLLTEVFYDGKYYNIMPAYNPIIRNLTQENVRPAKYKAKVNESTYKVIVDFRDKFPNRVKNFFITGYNADPVFFNINLEIV